MIRKLKLFNYLVRYLRYEEDKVIEEKVIIGANKKKYAKQIFDNINNIKHNESYILVSVKRLRKKQDWYRSFFNDPQTQKNLDIFWGTK